MDEWMIMDVKSSGPLAVEHFFITIRHMKLQPSACRRQAENLTPNVCVNRNLFARAFG